MQKIIPLSQMTWGMKGIILSPHSFSFSFFCLFPALFTAWFSRPEVEDEWTLELTRCVWNSVSLCVWERHIKLNWQTHGPLASRACDNHDIKSENFYGTHAHTRAHTLARRVCHTGSTSCSQEAFWWCCRFRRCSSCCCLCCCFEWDQYLKRTEQPPQNVCDWSLYSAIIFCHLIRCAEIKTLCFQSSQIWRTVSESKLASFWFVCAL